MEPLSVATSIVTILQLTVKVLDYINNAKNASEEQRKIASEASSVQGMLMNLRVRVGAACKDDPWFNQIKLMNTQDGSLDQMAKILQRMVDKIETTNKWGEIRNTLEWKFSRAEMMEALEHIERLKSLVYLVFTNNLL